MAKLNNKKTKTIMETIKESKKMLKKKPKRQGTMESVAQEAQDFLKYTEDAHKKRLDEKRALQKKANDSLIQKKPKKSKKISKETKKPVEVPAPKSKKAPAIKAKASAKNDKKAQKAEKTQKVEKDDKTTKSNKSSKSEKPPKKVEKPEKVEKNKKAEKNEKPEKVEKVEKKISKKASPEKKAPEPKKTAKESKPKPTSTKKKDAVPVSDDADKPASLKKDTETTTPSNKKKPVKQVSKLIESGLAAGMIDVVFCIDTTGSMDSYLEKSKDTVNKIVDQVKEKSKGESVSVRFAVVAYRDHPPQETTYLTKVKDLCPSDEILGYIKTLNCEGGGDGAEAVFDGLWESSKNISWRDSKVLPSLRYIFHITDAPPHGKQYGGYSEHWENTGCPCGHDVNKVAHVINIEQIHYRLIKIGPKLEKMAAEFKEKFTNYEEVAIDNATDMDIKITDMIIRELLPDTDMNLDI